MTVYVTGTSKGRESHLEFVEIAEKWLLDSKAVRKHHNYMFLYGKSGALWRIDRISMARPVSVLTWKGNSVATNPFKVFYTPFRLYTRWDLCIGPDMPYMSGIVDRMRSLDLQAITLAWLIAADERFVWGQGNTMSNGISYPYRMFVDGIRV